MRGGSPIILLVLSLMHFVQLLIIHYKLLIINYSSNHHVPLRKMQKHYKQLIISNLQLFWSKHLKNYTDYYYSKQRYLTPL